MPASLSGGMKKRVGWHGPSAITEDHLYESDHRADPINGT